MKNSHTDLIEAFQQYSKWNHKFMQTKTEVSSIKARYYLSLIRTEALQRRKEIRNITVELKKIRKGKPGRPRKAT